MGLKTSLYEEHIKLKGKMVEFAGYDLPVSYSGLVDEHQAVRAHVGLFDVSHMGEVRVTGKNALSAVNKIISNDLEKIQDGQALYTVMLKEDGGIVDDLIVYRISSEEIFICVNAANRHKDFNWIKDHLEPGVHAEDESDRFAQIAVQGPNAERLMEKILKAPVGLRKFFATEKNINNAKIFLARTGYTGEDGFELYLSAKDAPQIWTYLLEAGQEFGAKACGLGARDSLRLEAGMMLYGHDMDESIDPITAGLSWVVKMNKADFIGKNALQKIALDGPKQKRIGLEITGRGIAREGYLIKNPENQETIGLITSGTHSPTLKKAIAIARVNAKHAAAIGTPLRVDVRGSLVEARVVKMPFYVPN